MQVNIEVNGVEELSAALKEKVTMSDVKRVVRHNGMRLDKSIVANAVFVRGYATGATKRSIHLTMEDGGLTAKSGPTTEYAPYLEWGTRFMQAQPFVGPAFNVVKGQFISDLKRLMK
jgi:HK97 gp10 family phage protein